MSDKFNIPTVVVVYGATGDLMARKITPALYNLWEKGKLPPMFRVIGVSRRKMTNDEFREHVMRITKTYIKKSKMKKLNQFCELFYFQQGQFENRENFAKLAQEVGRIDGRWNVCSNKLFYLAVPPEYYERILNNLHTSGLTDPCSPEEGWTRVLIEKPFGSDLKTARTLDLLLSKLFKEEQIYRIDHYLGKDMLQNILAFRFSNNFLEESWNGKFIDRIDIRLHESIDVKDRGAFYDGLGALADVGQNHLLQMLSLVTMDNPVSLTASAIRTKRSAVLQNLVIPTARQVKTSTIRAQYEEYRQTNGVANDSVKETYFKVKAELDSSRWRGVPIYLSAGKGFKKPQKDITVTFRNPQRCLTCEPGQDYRNKVTFSLEPKEEISIAFFSKTPGLDLTIQEKDLSFTYRKDSERTQYVEEYEKLLLDCIEGDQTLFVSTDEVIPMWQYTDAIIKAWKKNVVPLKTYKRNSDSILQEKLSEEDKNGSFRVLKKDIAIIGLGKMGKGLVLQFQDRGWSVYGYNRTKTVTQALERQGINGLYNLSNVTSSLKSPRIVMLSLPSGARADGPIDTVLQELTSHLSKGDIVIDIGNSHYKDSIRRYKMLGKHGIKFVDVGISGGPEGARFGACCMIGGDRETYEYLEPLFSDISVPRGYQFFEGAGAGHFVKMVHNGIEYGMMQSIGEGFEVMKASPYKLDLSRVSDVYNHGSVIESSLISWLSDAYDQYGVDLKTISSTVGHLGEGAWTVETGKDLGVKTEIIEGSLQFRIDSEKNPSYTGKVVSALRGQFGGHSVKK